MTVLVTGGAGYIGSHTVRALRGRGREVVELDIGQAVPLGHKLALRDMPAGAMVRKYGEVIGVLTEAVGQGGHVHVHNLRSRRARAADATKPPA